MGSFTNVIKLAFRVATLSERSGDTPLSLFLDPAVPCNLDCVMCDRIENDSENEFEKSYYSLAAFKRLLDITNPQALTFTPTGEATMNKDLSEMVRYASEKGVYTTLTTNGTFLGKKNLDQHLLEAGLDYLRVSIDGATRETYKKVRGADALDLICKNIKKFIELKKSLGAERTHIRIDFTVQGDNVHEMKLLPAFAKGLGIDHIDYRILSMVLFSEEKQKKLLGDIQNKETMEIAFRNSKQTIAENKISSNLPVFKKQHLDTYCKPEKKKKSKRSKYAPVCLLPWLQLYSSVDGDIMPCGFMALNKNKYGTVGNIHSEDASNIWNSDKMRKTRKQFRQRTNYEVSECCRDCTIPYTLPMLIKLAWKTKDLSRLLGLKKLLKLSAFIPSPLKPQSPKV